MNALARSDEEVRRSNQNEHRTLNSRVEQREDRASKVRSEQREDRISSISFAEELTKEMTAREKPTAHLEGFQTVKLTLGDERAHLASASLDSLFSSTTAFMIAVSEDHVLFFFNPQKDASRLNALVSCAVSCARSLPSIEIIDGVIFSLPSRSVLSTYCCWWSWRSSCDFFRRTAGGVRHADELRMADARTDEFLFG